MQTENTDVRQKVFYQNLQHFLIPLGQFMDQHMYSTHSVILII